MARFTVTFLKSRSPAYAHATRLAHGAEAYRDDGAEHRAEYSGASIAALLELWLLVSRWRGSRLLIDDEPTLPRERLALLPVLECAATAARFDPPSRYCTSSTDPAAWPAIPCRYFMDRAGEWTLRQIINAPNRLDALRATLAKMGIARCPFFEIEAVAPRLADQPRAR